MDYFWVLAGISASFGALMTALVLRKLDISRMSYREAGQLLSAMVASLSARVRRNEVLVNELADQVQMLSAKQARVTSEAETLDKERLLGYMQDWIGNVGRFVDKIDALQRNLKKMDDQFERLQAQVNQIAKAPHVEGGRDGAAVGVVTEDTLAKLSETERKVLQFLFDGPKSGPEIGRVMMKSREHTARVMKSLFEQGFVERHTQRQPYEYRLNDKVRRVLGPAVDQQQTTEASL